MKNMQKENLFKSDADNLTSYVQETELRPCTEVKSK